MRYLIIIIAFVCCLSCAESEKDRITRLVKEWEGKEIIFPKHSVFTIQGKDTVDFSHANADYKVLTYVDSVGCTSCKLQLLEWEDFMHEVDSLTDSEVPFLFYFHPKDARGLLHQTRLDDFRQPFCLDKRDELNKLNRFPSEMTFQTFLLDRNNKVVVLGNPLHSPKVKEIYLQVLTDGKTVQPQ